MPSDSTCSSDIKVIIKHFCKVLFQMPVKQHFWLNDGSRWLFKGCLYVFCGNRLWFVVFCGDLWCVLWCFVMFCGVLWWFVVFSVTPNCWPWMTDNRTIAHHEHFMLTWANKRRHCEFWVCLFTDRRKTRGPRWPCISHLITRRFESIGLSVHEKKLNTDFQDGGHLGFPIRAIQSDQFYLIFWSTSDLYISN